MTEAHARAPRNVTAVILSHNSLGTLRQVLAAVHSQTYPVSKIIVVDNGSDDGSQAYLRQKWEDACLLLLDENLGVGAGHGIGWRLAMEDEECEFIWSLEHDCIPAERCLERLMQAYTDYSRVFPLGAVAPSQRVAQGVDVERVYIWSNGFKRRRGPPDAKELPYFSRRCTFNGVLFPITAIESVGLPRTDFCVGHEDIEHSYRRQRAGLRTLKVPAATVFHDITKPRKPIEICKWTILVPGPSVGRSYYSTRNAIYLARLHQDIRILLLKHLLKLPISLMYILFFQDRKLRRVVARLYAVRDGLRGNLGCKDYPFLVGHRCSVSPDLADLMQSGLEPH